MRTPPSAAARFLPQTLRQYALLADGERGALIGPHGNIVWMCAPSWHNDAVFSALLGGRSGYAITPVDPYVWGGYYKPGTLIWHSRWVTHSGVVESREALGFPGDPHRAVILRRINAVDADARVQIVLDPRAGFDRKPMRDIHRDAGVWTARTGELRLRWSGAARARSSGTGSKGLVLDVTVPAGEHRDLILEISDQPLPDRPPEPAHAWAATESAWAEAVPDLANCQTPQDAQRSYAVLRGLTSRTGGMVAAATTSLPERAGTGRNYDYRYVWIRDQCYAGQAVAAAGDHPLLQDAVRFVTDRLLADGDRMAPAYTTDARPVPDQHTLDLPGYPGGHNRIGNWVNQQFQLDAFGESLLLFAAAAGRDRMTADSWRAATVAADAIATRWTEPDAGIWEIDNRPWTHSRLICAAGLRALAAHVRPHGGAAADWLTLADKITADTSASSLHPTGRWQRSPDDPGLDAALLLPAIRGAVPADDPRTLATLAAYERELTVNGYAYRFRHDQRPLDDSEGAFTFCGFLLSLALHQQDRQVEATAWYERTRSCGGPPQLYSEEYDSIEHQLRGNLPQAFVHALHLEATARINPPDTVPGTAQNM